jgi:hypothetical protein
MIESALAFGTTPQQVSHNPGFQNWERTGTAVAHRHARAAKRYDVNERTAGPMPVFGQLLSKNTMAMAQMRGPSANALIDPMQDSVDQKPAIAYETLPAEDGYSFGDVVDMINPLHHLPVIGTLYRKFSGDTIKPFASIIGGTIFGGPVGAVSSTVNAIVKDRTGKDIAENALSVAGVDMTPSVPRKEDLIYLAPKEEEVLPARRNNLLGATQSYTHLGQRNFSATAFTAYSSAEKTAFFSSSQRWNA